MPKSDTIRLLVDTSTVDSGRKNMMPGLNVATNKLVEIGFDKLENNINNMLEKTLHLLSNVTLDSEDFEVDSITFSLNIDASGEVSLMSLAKGSLGGQTGLEFNIVRRNNEMKAKNG